MEPAPRRLPRYALVVGGIALLGAAVAGGVVLGRRASAPPAPVAAAPAPAPVAPPEVTRAITRRVRPSQNPTQVLASMDLSGAESRAVLDALQAVPSWKSIYPGDQVRIERSATDGALRSLSWRQRADREFVVAPCGATLCGAEREFERTQKRLLVSVTIQSSVWEALQSKGYDPALITKAADVLAWDVDFYQDVQPGDSIKLVVDRNDADGRFVSWGDVLAIQYEGKVAGRKRLFRFVTPDGERGYYDDAGTSARRGFLKAPLPYVQLTSRFGSRRHPLLGFVRAHQGVDYGAPIGTPVWAVGDGSVTQAGWNGGCGLSVQIRHGNGFETVYCHLSKVNVSAGTRVRQQQVVGKVGTTGLSTGPHLHYGVKRGGAYVNPLALKFPRGEPIKPELRASFQSQIDPARRQLDGEPIAMLR